MAPVIDTLQLVESDEHPLTPIDRPVNGADAPLEIGLVNNMADTALQATERQFMRLLNAAADRHVVRLHFYTLPSIKRSDEALQRIAASYDDFESLTSTRLDGLIVTGAEPKTAVLPEESYWDELAGLIDWAKENTLSTIWSCLAAHAAVYHLDRIERRQLAAKCSGVFTCARVAEDVLTSGLRWPLRIFHSRYNDVAERDLAAAGYHILTRAENAGADIFTKSCGKSAFVFFQGHPEYDPLSLQREYLRDVGRYLAGQQSTYPTAPTDYFDELTTASLQAFRLRALARRDLSSAAECRTILELATVHSDRRGAASTIVRNWLAMLSEARAKRAG